MNEHSAICPICGKSYKYFRGGKGGRPKTCGDPNCEYKLKYPGKAWDEQVSKIYNKDTDE